MKLKIKSSGIADRYDKNITHTNTRCFGLGDTSMVYDMEILF